MKKKLIVKMLKGVARLHLGMLYLLSDLIFPIVYYVAGYRRKVVRKNLTEAFPQKTTKEIARIEKDYYRFLCDVIVETVKLFHISDKELARRIKVEDALLVNESIHSGRSAVLMLGHYGNWEWVQEITKHFTDKGYMVSIYHPLANKLWDDIFQELRDRWHAHIVPMKKAVRTLLNPENRPWICGFIADHRPYHHDEAASVEFLNHKTYFIYGPEEIGLKVGADFFYLEMTRPKRGYYTIKFHRLQQTEDKEGNNQNLKFPITTAFWKSFEKTVIKNPSLWMWSHKRWK